MTGCKNSGFQDGYYGNDGRSVGVCNVINRRDRNPKYEHYVKDWLYCSPYVCTAFLRYIYAGTYVEKLHTKVNIAHLRRECRNSKFVIFQEIILKVSKCYNFL